MRKEMEMRLEQEKKIMQAEAEVEVAKAQAAQAQAEAQAAQEQAAKAQAAVSASQASAGSYDSSCNSPYGTVVMVKREGGYTNIRSGCGSNYGIVDKVRDGNYIKVGSCYGQWYEVYNGNGSIRGYIHASKIVF